MKAVRIALQIAAMIGLLALSIIGWTIMVRGIWMNW